MIYDRPARVSRRQLLRTCGAGLGMAGLSGLLAAAASTTPGTDPLAVKPPHFPAKAKHVIHLFLNGGPSHVDSFDHKPMLAKVRRQNRIPAATSRPSARRGSLMRSPFEFKPHGESGLEISEIFGGLASHADDLCIIKVDVHRYAVSRAVAGS